VVRRINVDSGRPLEAKAHYSRALRVGSNVMQSGTTAIDRDGNVLGSDVDTQIRAILDIARGSMAAAEGQFDDIVRARLYVVGSDLLSGAIASFNDALTESSPALTCVPVSRLARPEQLIEIELEATDGAAAMAAPILDPTDGENIIGPARGLRLGDRIVLGGICSDAASLPAQIDDALGCTGTLVETGGGSAADLVAIRLFVTGATSMPDVTDAVAERLGPVRPVLTRLAVPPFANADHRIMVEAEAVIGAGASGVATPHPNLPGFSETLRVGEHIYLSQIEPVAPNGRVIAADDWAAQRDACSAGLEAVLEGIGASLDDVVVRRFFTRADTLMNRGYGDGPGWFAATRPAALGCRIEQLPLAGAVLNLEAHAVLGAGTGIEWRKL